MNLKNAVLTVLDKILYIIWPPDSPYSATGILIINSHPEEEELDG